LAKIISLTQLGPLRTDAPGSE